MRNFLHFTVRVRGKLAETVTEKGSARGSSMLAVGSMPSAECQGEGLE
jgi:hypothetical protein